MRSNRLIHVKPLQPEGRIPWEVEGVWVGQPAASSHLTDLGTIHPYYAIHPYAKVMPKGCKSAAVAKNHSKK